MKVLRIEHKKTRLGPWSSGYEVHRQFDKLHDYFKLPAPYQEGIDPFSKKHGELQCGVINARKLIEWFPKKVRQNLHEQNFILCEYEINKKEVKFGKMQVCFPLKEAKLVRELLLSKGKVK